MSSSNGSAGDDVEWVVRPGELQDVQAPVSGDGSELACIPVANSNALNMQPVLKQLEGDYAKRLETLKTQTPDETVKVVVRIRPLSTEETRNGNQVVAVADPERGQIWVQNPIPRPRSEQPPLDFAFDAVYDDRVEQQHIYDTCAAGVVGSVLHGNNGTIFAYGQTGAGKTHTMEGAGTERGIIPNTFQHIFKAIASNTQKQYTVRASYLEIYNEEIRDLLSEDPETSLELKEDKDSGVYVKNLSSHEVMSVAEIEHVLQKGKNNRSTSSRSHSIFTIDVECRESDARGDHVRVGKLNLVDLAGSVRQPKKGANSERLTESNPIDKSFTALACVITVLVSTWPSSRVPYRDSKLTSLLQNSLRGNAKILMIAVISPADCGYEETLSTLRYASRVQYAAMQARLDAQQRQIEALQAQQRLDNEALLSMLRRCCYKRKAEAGSGVEKRRRLSGDSYSSGSEEEEEEQDSALNTGPWTEPELNWLIAFVEQEQQQEQLELEAGHQSTLDARKKVIEWEPIARELNRSRGSCQQKWHNIKRGIQAKSSELKKGPYSLEEDAIIRKRVAQWDKKGDKKRGLWSGLGRELGRTSTSVFDRGKILPSVGEANPLGSGGSDSGSASDSDSDPGESRPIAVGVASASGAFKGSFTEKMDALLLEGVTKFGLDWIDVAAHINKGSGCVVNNQQCSSRYRNKVNPALQELNNEPWTDEEVITTPITHTPIPPPPTLSIPRYPPNSIPLLFTHPLAHQYAQLKALVQQQEQLESGAGKRKKKRPINWKPIAKALNRTTKKCINKWY